MEEDITNCDIMPQDREESQNIEYKSSWRDEYLKWICGFANANGGKIYIGVEDHAPHNVVDLPNAGKLMEDIPNKIRDILGIMVDVNLLFDGDKRFIEIVIEPYPYPITYKGQYHYRSGSTKQELKDAGVDERSIAIVNYVLTEKRITNSDVQKLLNVSKPTATRLLASLSDYLVVTGSRGKGTFYSIKGLTNGSNPSD